ncbi:MAG: TonB-dependent receptor, partial [Chitinivibrionales bacterium]|nr:TonB-dependent receptor [Chitinivibrionales bacterium]MBD3357368.1 TonB-dependent receptor [Chitinivibrionales bacterium]
DSATQAPLAKATVSLLNTEYSAISDSMGRFELELIPPGSYTALASKWGYESSVIPNIAVREKERTKIQPRLAPRDAGMAAAGTGSIAGTVTTDSSAAFEKAIVFIEELGNATVTDALGAFTLEDIPSGIYTVAAFAEGFDTTKVNGIDVWAGEVAQVELHLREAVKPLELAGQTAIAGLVVDAEKGQPLSGVTVTVKDDRIKDVTDLDGNYALTDLKPGTYTIVASYDGYVDATTENLTVTQNQLTRADLVMSKSDLKEMQRMAVRGVAARNTDAALLKERQRAINVSDAIGAEEISRAGAGNAADAMKQVTGTTVVGGKYVYIRGLGDRYSTTFLNGLPIPSPDPDRKAVPLDLFPTSVIENINTIKTFTPDRPGNFTGGAVDIQTKAFPDHFQFGAKISGSLAPNVLRTDDFLTYKGGKTDWLAIDDGTRELDESLSDYQTIPPTEGETRKDDSAAALLDAYTKKFDSPMYTTSRSVPPNHGFSINIGNTREIRGLPIGYLGTLVYKRSYSFSDSGTVASYTQVGHIDSIKELESERIVEEDVSEITVLWGGLVSMAIEPSEWHKITTTFLYNRAAEDEIQHVIGMDKRITVPNRTMELWKMEYTQRNLWSLQAQGNHEITALGNLNARWGASLARTSQEEPDVRVTGHDFGPLREGSDVITYENESNSYPSPTRYYRDLRESNEALEFDLTLPFYVPWHDKTCKAGIGTSTNSIERSLRVHEFLFKPGGKSDIKYNGSYEEFFADSNMGWIDVEVREFRGKTYYTNIMGITVRRIGRDKSNYDATQKTPAWYGMLHLPILPKLHLLGGVRLELTRMKVATVAAEKDEGLSEAERENQTGEIEENDFLPSAGVVYRPTDNSNLRLHYGKTVARPSLLEFAPFSSVDIASGMQYVGNPHLKQTKIDNYDIRIEWFPNPGEVMAASAFYKDFEDAIERAFLNQNGDVGWKNVKEARLFGWEVEMRQKLGNGLERSANLIFAIPNILRGMKPFEDPIKFDVRPKDFLNLFEIGGNYTWVFSAVDVDEDELALKREQNPYAPDERSLQGQSPFILNAHVNFDSEELGLAASFYYNVFGKRLSDVGFGPVPDIYELPQHTINTSISKKIGKSFSFKLAVKNLLNASSKEIMEFKGKDFPIDQRGKPSTRLSHQPGHEYIINERIKERKFSLSIGYTFD